MGEENLAATGIRSTDGEKFYTVALNICGASVWNLLHVTILAPRILRRLLAFVELFGYP